MKRFFSNPLLAAIAGACLRLWFVLKFPTSSGDTVLYDELATNWLKAGKLAMNISGQVTPVDLRMPGYPGFLALVYAATRRVGESARFPVMLAQVAVDLGGCFAIAALATLLAKLAGQESKAKRVFLAALWMAALCPFTANYVAVPLTEVWAVLLTAVASVFLVAMAAEASGTPLPAWQGKQFAKRHVEEFAAAGGFVVGLGTLFRPETPLLLITTFFVLAYWLVRRGELKRWVMLCALMSIACGVALAPWTLRNALTLREFQPLAPKDAMLPGEVDPRGFMAWEKTWLYRMKDTYLVTWKLNDDEIHMEDIPDSAFDTQDERDRVAMVLERYNDEVTWTVEEDAAFAQLARERTCRHPFRTYVTVPLRRALHIWFTPRIELLPISGHVFPLAYQWEEDPVDQRLTVLLFLLNIVDVALGLWGAWKLWKYPGARAAVAVLFVYIVIRTAFLTTMESPEPRYVLECFPALLALGAQAIWKDTRDGRSEVRGSV